MTRKNFKNLKIYTPVIAAVFAVFTYLFKGDEIRQWILDVFEKKESHITKDEHDVFNEWVIKVQSYDKRQDALKDLDALKREYYASGHSIWANKIFCVRSPSNVGDWMIVIDSYKYKSSKAKTDDDIRQIISFCDHHNLKDTFKSWINNSQSYFYNGDEFKKNYGEVGTEK